MRRTFFSAILIFTLVFFSLLTTTQVHCGGYMTNYCYIPPFTKTRISQPSLLMIVMSKDHSLFYQAYNDATDLDGDGKVEITYNHQIDYYGYFDPYKCYEYSGDRFIPQEYTTDKFCTSSTYWSGNVLNWATMTHMDILRKVLYGGQRSIDTATETELQRVWLPQDSHSWGKEFTGKLCYNSTNGKYTKMCSSDINCGGYSCINKSTNLTPLTKPSTSNKRHLFCSTSISNNPSLRIITNTSKRIWEWTLRDAPICKDAISLGWGVPTNDYTIKVKVCDKTKFTNKSLEKEGCKLYRDNYKPIGLFQRYGEGSGVKVCSKRWTKTCNTDNDCSSMDGVCIEKSNIYWGLITGSYSYNTSGGVLRKNLYSISDISTSLPYPYEINPNDGRFNSSSKGIIWTINTIGIEGYEGYSYSCGWITTREIANGECESWGNPIGEMMYETMRYFYGLSAPTNIYKPISDNLASINLPLDSWGLKNLSTNITYYGTKAFPYCSKLYMLTIGPQYPTFDSDEVPTFNNSNTSDMTEFNSVTLMNRINSTFQGSDYFLGSIDKDISGVICSKYNLANFSSLISLLGLCHNEPTQKGGYSSLISAYYGKSEFKLQKGQEITTYNLSIPLHSLNFRFNVNNKPINIIPIGKSVSGTYGIGGEGGSCYNSTNGSSKGVNFTTNSNGLYINGYSRAEGDYCPTNTITNLYFEDIEYDGNNLVYAIIRIGFESTEQGADYDTDTIAVYELCVDSKCSPAINSDQLKISVSSKIVDRTTSDGIDKALGFIISGTTEDNTYLVVQSRLIGIRDYNTPNEVVDLKISWNKTFTISSPTSNLLPSPLWYAAKYGGFLDINKNGLPDVWEWDIQNNITGQQIPDGIPDTYFIGDNFYIVEKQLESVFYSIPYPSLETVSEILGGQSINRHTVVQSYTKQEKQQDNILLKWLGYLRTLWIDPLGNIRENTDTTNETDLLKILDTIKDKIITFFYDSESRRYKTNKYIDVDGDSKPETCLSEISSADTITTIFEGGEILKNTHPDARVIKFWNDSNNNGTVDSEEFTNLSDTYSISQALKNLWRYSDLGDCDSDCASSVIKYIIGYDLPNPSGSNFRLRQSATAGQDIISTWKLGNSVLSIPKILPNEEINNYTIAYSDNTYNAFIQNTIKPQKSIVLIGANDGMLHAFGIGKSEEISPAIITEGSKEISKVFDTDKLGKELWSFIPRNALPYLRWYCQNNYCHIPTADSSFIIIDVSIGGESTNLKDATTWKRLLIGTMGFGGKRISFSNPDLSFGSSIFVLDITDSLNPKLLWEKPLPDSTLASVTPSIVRLGDPDKNGDWFLVVGSGPLEINNSIGKLKYVTEPKIYVFDLKTGVKLAQKEVFGSDVTDIAATNTAVGDILSVDMDGDYQTDVLYFGTYNKDKGRLYRLRIRDNNGNYITNPSNWFIGKVTQMASNPIFASPSIAIDEQRNKWLYYATGIYLTLEHEVVTDEKIVGVKEIDSCWKGNNSDCNIFNTFLDTTNIIFKDAVASKISCRCQGGIVINEDVCSNDICPSCIDYASRFVTEVKNAVLYNAPIESGCSNKKDIEAIKCLENYISNNYQGWFFNLINGKVYSPLLVSGGIVNALSFSLFPSDSCISNTINTNISSLYYKTGTTYSQPATSIDYIGLYIEIQRTTKVGEGMPIIKQGLTPIITSDGYNLYVQTSKDIINIPIKSASPSILNNKFILWLTR